MSDIIDNGRRAGFDSRPFKGMVGVLDIDERRMRIGYFDKKKTVKAPFDATLGGVPVIITEVRMTPVRGGTLFAFDLDAIVKDA